VANSKELIGGEHFNSVIESLEYQLEQLYVAIDEDPSFWSELLNYVSLTEKQTVSLYTNDYRPVGFVIDGWLETPGALDKIRSIRACRRARALRGLRRTRALDYIFEELDENYEKEILADEPFGDECLDQHHQVLGDSENEDEAEYSDED
jgi:hypothetical protein